MLFLNMATSTFLSLQLFGLYIYIYIFYIYTHQDNFSLKARNTIIKEEKYTSNTFYHEPED